METSAEQPKKPAINLQSVNDAALMLQHILSLVNRRVLLSQEIQEIDQRISALTTPNQDIMTRLGIIIGENNNGKSENQKETS